MNLRQQLKFTARGFLSSAKPSPLLVGQTALALNLVFNILDDSVTNAAERTSVMLDAYQQYMAGGTAEHFVNQVMATQPGFVQELLSVLISLMTLMISTGLIIYVITEARYHKGGFGNLLDGLPVLFRVVCYQIISSIYVFLWSLLLVIPGLIAHYRYRQGLYLLLDHPEMSVTECLRASKFMMKGHKKELFLLDMSFFGWIFGESFLLQSLGMVFADMPYIANLLILPLSAFVQMYMEFTQFLYYEHLQGIHYDTRIPNVNPTES